MPAAPKAEAGAVAVGQCPLGRGARYADQKIKAPVCVRHRRKHPIEMENGYEKSILHQCGFAKEVPG